VRERETEWLKGQEEEETGGLMDAYLRFWPSGLLSPRSLILFNRESVCVLVRVRDRKPPLP